jgi:hypothetical protein
MQCESGLFILHYCYYKNGMYVQWHEYQLSQDLEMCEFSVFHVDESNDACDEDSSLLGCVPNKP